MSNPLLTSCDGPYGLPDLSSITIEHYREGLEAGLAEHRGEIDAITSCPEAPNFENTCLALERSGRLLGRVSRILSNKLASDSDEQLRDLEEEFSPRYSAHSDSITFNSALFARIKAVAESDEQLDDEQRQLVRTQFTDFELAGANLDDKGKQRLGEINQEMSQLTTKFNTLVLNELNDLAVWFASADELDGLSAGELEACAQAAHDAGHDGGYLVALVNTTLHPMLSQLTCRESRRRIYEATALRGRRGNDFDTRWIISRLVALRAERAGLLGFADHVSAVVHDQTVGDSSRITEVVYPMAVPALANMEHEADELQAAIDADCAATGAEPYRLAAWDWPFWAEKVRAEKFSVDTAALRDWFEYDRVLVDGVFWTATQLYGITFEERAGWTTYHPDARVFEVFDHDGSAMGLFIHDPYARPSKRGGAWMNNLVEQNHLFGERPVIVNNLNVPRPPAGEPTLLSLDNVRTMFHEFGHALHGLLSNATFPSLSGTHVPRDFVEFPSQVNEMWMTWPEVVNNYARHHVTGEPLAQEVLERLEASAAFNQGMETTEYLAATLVDQEWHRLAPGAVIEASQVEDFEQQALVKVGLANEFVAPRYRSPYFSHTFGGGYDARYYAYIWSEVLDADTVEWFRENGGLNRSNGQVFRDELLSRGLTRDPLVSFRALRGRDAAIEPLMRRRGLA